MWEKLVQFNRGCKRLLIALVFNSRMAITWEKKTFNKCEQEGQCWCKLVEYLGEIYLNSCFLVVGYRYHALQNKTLRWSYLNFIFVIESENTRMQIYCSIELSQNHRISQWKGPTRIAEGLRLDKMNSRGTFPTPASSRSSRSHCPGSHPGGFWIFQKRRVHSPSRQLVPVLCNSQSNSVFSDVQMELLVFQFETVENGLASTSHPMTPVPSVLMGASHSVPWTCGC